MDKKLLVSLMMTAPVAAFAQANWTTAGGNLTYSIQPLASDWESESIDALSSDGDVLTCLVSAGQLSHIAILPQGEWTIGVPATLTNALVEINGELSVKRNDKGQALDAAGKVTTDQTKMVPVSKTLKLGAETAVVIKIVPADPQLNFKVSKVTAELKFDFAAAKTSIQAAFDKVAALKEVPEGDERTQADDLRDTLAELQAQKAAIQAAIDALDSDGAELYNAYVDSQMYNWQGADKANDKISKDIAALNTAVTAYNKDVDTETTIYNNIVKNTAALETLRGDVLQLQANLDQKKKDIYDVETGEDTDSKKGQYCQFICQYDIDAAQAAIDKYSADIEAAYKNLEATVNFPSQTETINNQINDIDWTVAAADWDAYADFLKELPSVQNKYGEVFAQINSIDVQLDGENVYADVIGTANTEITKIYNNNLGYAINQAGGLDPKNTNISGAAANLKTAEGQMTDRKNEMEGVYKTLKKLQEDQDKEWADAKAQVADLQKELNEKKAILDNEAFSSLTEKDQQTVKNDIDAIQKAIDAALNAAKTEYKNHDLDADATGTSFSKAKDKVTEANNKYKDETKNFATVLDLITALQVQKDEVHAKTSVKKLSGYDLEGKFADTYANISNAIDLYYKNPTPGAATQILEAINNISKACTDLVNAFTAAVDQLNSAEDALKAFNAAIDKKVVVTINGVPAYNKASYSYTYVNEKTGKNATLTAASVAKAINDYRAKLSEIGNGTTEAYANPQKAYEAANAESIKIVKDAFSKYVPEAQADFEKVVTKANLAAVEEVAADIKVKKEEEPYNAAVGMDKVGTNLDLPKDYKGSQNVEEAASAVTAAGDDAAKLAVCDGDLVVLAAAYDKVYDQIKKVVANDDEYHALLDAASLAQQKLDQFSNDIEKNTIEPAVSYYKGRVEKFKDALNKANQAIVKSYNNITEVADSENNSKLIQDVVDAIAAENLACIANDNKYDEQIVKAQEIAENANKLIDWLNEHDKVKGNLDKYLKDIEGVTSQLADLNVEITKSFANGTSVQDNPEYVEDFNALTAQLEAIYNAETEGYLTAVKNANNDYLKGKKLGDGQLDSEYEAAIAQVNKYRYDITNAGYYKALTDNEDFQKNHEDLQKCYSQISELNKQISTFVEGLTAGTDRDKWVVLVDNSVVSNKIKLSDLVTKASDISNEVSTLLNKINTIASGIADDYYAQQLTKAQGIYDNIVNRLITAGFTIDQVVDGKNVPGEVSKAVENLTSALNAAKDGKAAYDKDIAAGKANAVPNYILGMSGIADQLDKITPVNENKFVYDAIKAQWTADYNAAVADLNKYISDIDGYTSANNQAAVKTALQNALKEANELNTNWNKLNDQQKETGFNKYDNIDLENLLQNAKNLIDTAKAEHELAIKNSLALGILINNADSYYNNTQSALDELLAWSGYHEAQLETIEGLQNQIDNLKKEIEGNEAVANDNLDANKTEFNTIKNDIDAAYKTVFDQEVKYAVSLLEKAKSAFNTAKLNGVAEADLDKYDVQIKDLDKKIKALKYDKAKKDALHAEVLGYEDQLCALIAELDGLGNIPEGKTNLEIVLNGDPTIEGDTGLNGQFNGLTTKYSDFKTKVETEGAKAGSYGEAVSEKYGSDIQEILDELNGINADYMAAGVDVIADADKYAYDMDQLGDKYNGLFTAWDNAQKEAVKKYTSDTKYDELSKQLTGLMQNVNYAFNQSELYHSYCDLSVYNEIAVLVAGRDADENGVGAMEGETARLEREKKAYSLTADSELNAALVSDANWFVRETLYYAARQAESDAMNYSAELQNSIFNAGVNENNRKFTYFNQDEILEDLNAEYLKALDLRYGVENEEGYRENSVNNTIRLSPLTDEKGNVVKDENGNIVYRYNNAAEAKTAYESILESVEEINANLTKIFDDAQENKIIKGDLDDDGDITVLDVQKLINEIGEGVNIDDPKEFGKRDLNDDDQLNVADVTSLIDEMMHLLPSEAPAAQRLRAYLPAVSGENSIVVAEVTGENGLRRFAVSLSNEVEFAAGQLDIVLPSHAKVAGVSLGDRANALDAYVFDNANGARVIMTSLDNSLIEGNSGCVLFIDVEGNAELEVENVIFSDVNGNAYDLSKGASSGVDGIYESLKDGVKAIYNAAGQKLRGLTKGINIIRNADGTTTKKIGK